MIHLLSIYSGQVGGFFAAISNLIGKMLGVKSAPIEFGIEGKRRWLHIENLLDLQIEGTVGGDPNQEAVIVNPAFSAVPGFQSCNCAIKQIHLTMIMGCNGIALAKMVFIANSNIHPNFLFYIL